MDFEELGKKLKKFSQDTVTEVQKMNEVRQLNGKISDEKKLLNRLYLEMGQKLYDTYKDVELPLEEFDSDFRKIRERYVAIDLLQEKIRNVKGVVLCPCCNMEVAAGDRYCTNCGNKMPETVKLEETTDEDAVEVESTVVEPEAAEAETESADKAEETCEAAKQTIAEDETTSEEETEAAEPGVCGSSRSSQQKKQSVRQQKRPGRVPGVPIRKRPLRQMSWQQMQRQRSRKQKRRPQRKLRNPHQRSR